MLEKEAIIDRNYLLNKRKDARVKKHFTAFKHRLFVVGIILGLLIIAIFYFLNDISRIYRISVFGNYYYDRHKIIALSGIEEDDIWLFSWPFIAEGKIKNDPLIKDVEVRLEDDLIVAIEVSEYKIIAYFNDLDAPYYVLENGDMIKADSANMDFLSEVPLIEGYSKEELRDLAPYFNELDKGIIAQISEIHRYPVSYDEKMMEVIMKDGNYVFVSPAGLNLLKQYFNVLSSIGETEGNFCLYFDDVTSSGYKSSCPWTKSESISEEEKEEE